MERPPLYQPRPERWPRISLRGFCVLVAVLGGSLGWFAVQMKWIRDRHEAQEWVLDCGAFYYTRLSFCVDEDEGEWSAPWSIRIFGERGYSEVSILSNLHAAPTADELQLRRRVQSLFPEAIVDFEPWIDFQLSRHREKPSQAQGQ